MWSEVPPKVPGAGSEAPQQNVTAAAAARGGVGTVDLSAGED